MSIEKNMHDSFSDMDKSWSQSVCQPKSNYDAS